VRQHPRRTPFHCAPLICEEFDAMVKTPPHCTGKLAVMKRQQTAERADHEKRPPLAEIRNRRQC
jgi:hypothetical protein